MDNISTTTGNQATCVRIRNRNSLVNQTTEHILGCPVSSKFLGEVELPCQVFLVLPSKKIVAPGQLNYDSLYILKYV